MNDGPPVDPLREALERLIEAGVTPERGPWKAGDGSIGFRSPQGFYFRLIGEDIEALVNAALASPAVPPEGLDVERLAAAICNGEASRAPGSPGWDYFSEEARDLFRREARDLAAEYARLSDTGEGEK